MDIHIRLTRRGDFSVQIYRQILEAVLDGRFRPGDRLPATREFARRLGVSRNTVAVAYERLVAEGVLDGRVGAGSFISLDSSATRVSQRSAPAGAVQPRDVWRSLPFLPRPQAMRYDFGVGTPDPHLFPLTTWRRLLSAELGANASRHAGYGEAAGVTRLRASIARHVSVSRGVRACADDVIVTSGAQQAFDLIGRVLVTAGASVAVEEPGYRQVRLLFRSLGAHVVGVPVDEEGLAVDAIPRDVRLVYVTPSHQFPLGRAMSLQRRMALLAWAERRGGVVIEDDYDSEFRFDGRPLDPVQSLDRKGRVIYVGSFSKVLIPALRVGFLIAPASLRPALTAAKQLTDWHGETSTQAALARFIDAGLLAGHIRKAAREYGGRYQQIVEVLDRRFAKWLEVVPGAAGLHVAALLRKGCVADMTQVVRLAARRGVRVETLAAFFAGPVSREGLVIGYGAIPTSRIDDGLALLKESFKPQPSAS
jgi:GntR family transcriptional regulator/MocR family aminotransferase